MHVSFCHEPSDNSLGQYMKLSLSVRVAEAACKTRLHLPLEQLIEVAIANGYEAICMRASCGGVQTPERELQRQANLIHSAGLSISMVTADFDVPLNNSNGPDSLRDIRPSLDVAQIFGCDLIRICMKNAEDIPYAVESVRRADEHNIRLAHQCHTSSLFEQVGPMLEVVSQIDHPAFGIIYEPANLMLNGESYLADTLERLRPHLMNVYVQNHRLDPVGPESLPTYCRGDVRFHHMELWQDGGVDFADVFAGLTEVNYDGFFTIHQAQGIETVDDLSRYASDCAQFFQRMTQL